MRCVSRLPPFRRCAGLSQAAVDESNALRDNCAVRWLYWIDFEAAK